MKIGGSQQETGIVQRSRGLQQRVQRSRKRGRPTAAPSTTRGVRAPGSGADPKLHKILEIETEWVLIVSMDEFKQEINLRSFIRYHLIIMYSHFNTVPEYILSKLLRSRFYNLYNGVIVTPFRDRRLGDILRNSRMARKPIMFIISEDGVHDCVVNLINQASIAKKIVQVSFYSDGKLCGRWSHFQWKGLPTDRGAQESTGYHHLPSECVREDRNYQEIYWTHINPVNHCGQTQLCSQGSSGC